MNKVALVTGASSGIGLDAALKLIKEGYTVYGAARRVELMKALEQAGGKAVFLDLCDTASIKKCVKSIIKKEGKIDVLVNNAGFGLGGSIEDVPAEEVKKQFDVNVFGLTQLIQLVLPSMRENHCGKIINVSSIAGKFSSPFTGWYHATKHCVEAISDALRLEVAPFGIKVVIIEPGMIQTDWGVIHGKNIRKFSGKGAYKENTDTVAQYYENAYVNSKNLSKPELISKLIVKAVLKKNPKPRYAAGTFSFLVLAAKKILSDTLFDKALKLIMNFK